MAGISGVESLFPASSGITDRADGGFETLFALLYGFIYSQRIPDLQETAAILLLLGGVLVTVHYHQLSRRGYAGNSPEVKGS
jgi:hypothetical protein